MPQCPAQQFPRCEDTENIARAGHRQQNDKQQEHHGVSYLTLDAGHPKEFHDFERMMLMLGVLSRRSISHGGLGMSRGLSPSYSRNIHDANRSMRILDTAATLKDVGSCRELQYGLTSHQRPVEISPLLADLDGPPIKECVFWMGPNLNQWVPRSVLVQPHGMTPNRSIPSWLAFGESQTVRSHTFG